MINQIFKPDVNSDAATQYDRAEEARFRAAVKQALEDIVQAFNTLLELGLFHNGRIYIDEALDTTAVELFHGFGRVPTMVFPLMRDAAEVIYTAPHPDPRQFVYVLATGPVTANLVVI